MFVTTLAGAWSAILLFFPFFALAQSSTATLAQVLDGDGRFGTLYNYLAQAGIRDSLNTYAGNLTLVAPTDDAFTKLWASPLGSSLFAGPEHIPRNFSYFTALLRYHAIMGTGPANQTQDSTGTFYQTFLNNDAYELVPQNQLAHFVNGSQNSTWYFAAGQKSNVTGDPLPFRNGIIYPVDTVMVPPYNASRTALDTNLISFAGFLEAANMTSTVDRLHWPHGVTVLAPLTAAFAALNSSLSNMSLLDLQNTLTYHILPLRQFVRIGSNSETLSANAIGGVPFTNGSYVETVAGANALDLRINPRIEVTVTADGETYLNDARVVAANILLNNGLLHVIDKVLDPSTASSVQNSSISATTSTMSTTVTSTPFATLAPSATTTIPLDSVPTTTPTSAAEHRYESQLGSLWTLLGFGVVLAAGVVD